METTLIETKLHLPFIHGDLVDRPQLIRRLNQNPNRKFTLVSAPAGFGKTTLIASWLSRQQSPYAWVSLDKLDNNPALFLRTIATAIKRFFPDSCLELLRSLEAPDLPTMDELAAITINEINILPQRMLLVLDDYHAINNTSILQLVERILEQSPSPLHLVIISRADPLLPLPRWRLQRGIVEMRQQELRFSDQEAEQFMQAAVSGQLDHEMVIRLNQRMEGWVAALRLASLSIQNRDEYEPISLDKIGEPQEYITSYLFTEVLTHQPVEVQDFLLQTAFVDRFCPDLSQELVHFSSQDITSQSIIAHLQRDNIFIIPLDDEDGWFRYHHLFQQMLQQKASTQLNQEVVIDLQNRAGNWFAQNGFVDEALQQYLSAGNMASIVSLIEANSQKLLNGVARRRLERWMDLLPAEIIWDRPRLLIAKAWLLYRHWRLEQLSAVLMRIKFCLERDSELDSREKDLLIGQMLVLSSVNVYCLEKNYAKCIKVSEQALSLLPPSEQGALGVALSFLALSSQANGRSETAVERLNLALTDLSPQGPAWIQIYLGLSFVHLAAGDLLKLNRVVERFLAASKTSPLGIPPANWVSGIANYEANHINVAKDAFATVAALHYSTNFFAACESWLGLARIYQEEGRLVQAQDLITTAKSEALRLDCTDLLPVIEGMQAYQWHLQVETAPALRWASAFEPDSSPDFPMLTFIPLFYWVRILAAHGDEVSWLAARTTLKAKLLAAQKHHFVRRQIQLLAHLALIENKLGNLESARFALAEAVNLGQSGGFVRSIVDCGPALRPLLEDLQQQGVAPHYLPEILDAFPHQSPNITVLNPVETVLTNREGEILQLMETGKSNKEIAQELVISLYTVKRHASNIYRKLDVDGRKQAIQKARRVDIPS